MNHNYCILCAPPVLYSIHFIVRAIFRSHWSSYGDPSFLCILRCMYTIAYSSKIPFFDRPSLSTTSIGPLPNYTRVLTIRTELQKFATLLFRNFFYIHGTLLIIRLPSITLSPPQCFLQTSTCFQDQIFAISQKLNQNDNAPLLFLFCIRHPHFGFYTVNHRLPFSSDHFTLPPHVHPLPFHFRFQLPALLSCKHLTLTTTLSSLRYRRSISF